MKNIILFITLISLTQLAGAKKNNKEKVTEVEKGMSRTEFALYMADCRKLFVEAFPNKDIDDIYMMCSDPYLVGITV